MFSFDAKFTCLFDVGDPEYCWLSKESQQAETMIVRPRWRRMKKEGPLETAFYVFVIKQYRNSPRVQNNLTKYP